MTNSSKKFSIFLVVLIDLIGFGIVLPLLPFFAEHYQVGPIAIGCLFGVYSFMQFCIGPYWGRASDRWGRRTIMLISTFGSAVSYLLFTFSTSFYMLFISRMIAGIMAGNISSAQAYLADLTDKQDRTAAMGIIGAAFGLGFTIGPALSALMLHPIMANWIPWHELSPYKLPGLVAFSLSSMSFLAILSFIQEPKRKKRPSAEVFSPIKNLKAITNRISTVPLMVGLFFVFLISFSQASLYGIFPLYCKYVHGFDAWVVGCLYFISGIISALIQGGLIRILSRVLSDKINITIGISLFAFSFLAISFISNANRFIVMVILMAVGASISVPALQGLISKNSDKLMQGEKFGYTQSVSGLGRMLGPIWGGALYIYSPQLPFLITGLLIATSLLMVFAIKNSFIH